MEMSIKKGCMVGIMLVLIPCIYGVDYEADYKSLFLNNKTNHDLLLHFCNEDHVSQQQYPMKPNEHRAVRIKIGVMKKLSVVQVIMYSHKKSKEECKKATQKCEGKECKKAMRDCMRVKKVMKDIYYDKNAGIVGLEISLKPDLDLIWRHEEEYIVAPTEE